MIRCPDQTCREPMVRRHNGKTGEEFYGCSRYPDCKETMPVPESIRLREAGAPELPGFSTDPPRH